MRRYWTSASAASRFIGSSPTADALLHWKGARKKRRSARRKESRIEARISWREYRWRAVTLKPRRRRVSERDAVGHPRSFVVCATQDDDGTSRLIRRLHPLRVSQEGSVRIDDVAREIVE